MRSEPGLLRRMPKRSIQTMSQRRPASSWPVDVWRDRDIRVIDCAGEENRKLDSGFLRNLGHFDLHAVGNGLRSGVAVNDVAEW
jgi:hypothetical protein